jgi:hypothetical protein
MTATFRSGIIHWVVVAGRGTGKQSQKPSAMSWKNLISRNSGIACETRLEAGYFSHE